MRRHARASERSSPDRLEDRNRLLRRVEQLVGSAVGIAEQPYVGELETRAQLEPPVAGRTAAVSGRCGENVRRPRWSSPAARSATPSSQRSSSRNGSSLGSSAVARPSRFTAAGVSPRFQARMPAAPSRVPASAASVAHGRRPGAELGAQR